ncbi:MAG TPA: alpha/beta hydrolase [Actinomycetota bacterium]|nr:alpha/beta hydrolase [Actinomycetota bacterium]
MNRRNVVALGVAVAGVGAAAVAQKSLVKRRRRNDPEAAESFGKRRGVRTRTLELPDGARLWVEEAGPETKRGAVFLHGLALRTDAWYYQLAGLGDHRLVFYDLRGHGLSQPKGDDEYTMARLAEDLRVVLDDCGLEEAVLVGHSTGGMTVLRYCVDHVAELGERVRGIVLVNTTYRPATETLAGGALVARVERLIRKPLDFLGTQAAYVDNLRKIVRPSDAVFWAVALAGFGRWASAKQIDFTYDMLAETPTDVIFDLIKCYRDFNVSDVVADINVPALVVGGTSDRITIADASQYLAEHLPKAELHLFARCGHMAMMERHRDFNELLEGFLNDTLGAPKAGTGAR